MQVCSACLMSVQLHEIFGHSLVIPKARDATDLFILVTRNDWDEENSATIICL